MPAAVVSFWSDLSGWTNEEFRLRRDGGAEPPYNFGGETISVQTRKSMPCSNSRTRFENNSPVCSVKAGIGHGAGSSTPELYWELLDVDDQGVVTLGASYNKAAGNGAYQSADVLYYASGGYYVSITLYQMWPVTIQGKASTLVWRGDMISSASLGSLHGVERLASESAMMKEISKAVALFRKDTARQSK